MSNGEQTIEYECSRCGDRFDESKVKKVKTSLYGIIKEELRCPKCNKGPIYVLGEKSNGRYTNAYAYMAQIK